MQISKIIYYTRRDNTSIPLSLHNLCPKDEKKGLETIFYLVKDATDIQDFVKKWNDTYYNQIEFECEKPSYIRFIEIDTLGHKNFLKLKIKKTTPMEAENEND